jgi:hypothetical protein
VDARDTFFKIFYYIFLFTGFINCTREVEPDLGILEEKLWIYAELDSFYGFTASIDRAIPLTSDKILFDEIKVTNASVFLSENLSGIRWQAPFDTKDGKFKFLTAKPEA